MCKEESSVIACDMPTQILKEYEVSEWPAFGCIKAYHLDEYFLLFQIRSPGVFGYIELRVLNNHGNKEYTCLYRFRVHGVPHN